MPRPFRSLVLIVALLLAAVPLSAQQPARETRDARPSAAPRLPPAETLSVTRHEVRVDGRPLRYTATAGYMPLRTEAGEHRASIFYIAYTRDGEDAPRRPVTFTFNGGPGSSSVWLHMGGLGPKRVPMGPEGEVVAPPYRVVDNEHTWLAFTDLVFIDPVTTGYSRATSDEAAKAFHGLREDAESVADFIRLYTTRHDRWLSPKFLAGESYGTTRAAALSGLLQQRHGMYLNGVSLISAILNFQTVDFAPGNDLPFLLHFPTYTATAWFHRKLPAELQSRPLRTVLDEAERFVVQEYSVALMKGSALSAAERRAVAERVARFTGLSTEFVERANLRVDLPRFTKELLRDRGRTVGRLDSRFAGIDRDAAGERFEYDPSMSAIRGPYTAAVMDHLRGQLGFRSDLPYEILTGRVRPWSYAEFTNRYVDVAETLREAMSENRDLRVFVAKGLYDFATPYFAAEYTLSHLGLDPALRGNITEAEYEAGHMMYIQEAALAKLTRDAAAFYRAALAARPPQPLGR